MPNWNTKIPGCENFYWGEVVNTSHDVKKHRQEFNSLPEKTKKIVMQNVIAVANQLQVARNYLKFPIPISSWWRSKRVEKLVGGSGANHPWGSAVDPKLHGSQLRAFLNFFKDHHGGVGTGQTKGHIDLGYGHKVKKRRWPY